MVFGRLFGGLLGTQPESPIEADGLVYAVGDIHGRLDLLDGLLARIVEDAGDRPADLIFVGDAVDRGPDSRGVVERLMTLPTDTALSPRFLMGNHELMMLGFLDDPVAERRWLRFGGLETLMSYGIRGVGDQSDPENLARLAGALRMAMGPHEAFMRGWEASYLTGSVLITHAGADPEVSAYDQSPDVLAWGAPEFLKKRRKDGLWVVYGHTIVDVPIVEKGRIAIDTGAFRTGVLTALKLDGPQPDFMTEIGPTGAAIDIAPI